MKSDRPRAACMEPLIYSIDVCSASPQSWELLAAKPCGPTNVELCIKPPEVDFYSGRLAKSI
jgi:hypothetical protein